MFLPNDKLVSMYLDRVLNNISFLDFLILLLVFCNINRLKHTSI